MTAAAGLQHQIIALRLEPLDIKAATRRSGAEAGTFEQYPRHQIEIGVSHLIGIPPECFGLRLELAGSGHDILPSITSR
jgi:hypothetical protein